MTLDDFNFLEMRSGVSSADGEKEKKLEIGTLMLSKIVTLENEIAWLLLLLLFFVN